MRYFILLSYNGKNYSGWQKQQNAYAIQEHLESAFKTFLREDVEITGAGRTDSSVNAINYIAHFNSSQDNVFKDPSFFIYKMNAILNDDIVVHNICQVADDAHARFDAISRSYKYHIHTCKDPFASQFSTFFPYDIDIDAMNRAAQYFIGTQDFKSMEKLHGGNQNSICTVTEAIWEPTKGDTHFVFKVTANRFLRNMVRAMVGSLLEVGRGKREPEWIIELLKEQNRSKAGNSVAGNALFLTEIKYPYKLF